MAWDWDSVRVHTDLYGGDDGAKTYTESALINDFTILE